MVARSRSEAEYMALTTYGVACFAQLLKELDLKSLQQEVIKCDSKTILSIVVTATSSKIKSPVVTINSQFR